MTTPQFRHKVHKAPVDGSNISSKTVTAEQIAANTITAGEIQAETITGNEIAADAITAEEIAAKTVTADEIAANTITGAEVSALSMSGKIVLFDTGTIGGWTLTSATLQNLTDGDGIVIDASAETITVGTSAAEMTPTSKTGIFVGSSAGTYEFRAGDPSGNRVHWDGSTLTVVGAVSGTITASDLSGTVPLANTDIAEQGWTIATSADPSTDVFTASSADRVSWTNCRITTAAGTTYGGIVAGNTGNMTARTYIYFDSSSPTALQTSTTATDAIGSGKVLVAVAEDATGAAGAFLQVFGGFGGLSITANEIAANAITANEIAANTITAAEISAGVITGTEINATFNLSGKTVTANSGTVGGWTMTSTTLQNLTAGTGVVIDASAETITVGTSAADMTPTSKTGIFIGASASTYEFRAGDPSGNKIHWDGTNLTVVGDISNNRSLTDWGSTETFTPSYTGSFPAGSAPAGDLNYAVTLDGLYAKLWMSADYFGPGADTQFIINNLPSSVRPAGTSFQYALGDGMGRNNTQDPAGVGVRIYQSSAAQAGQFQICVLTSAALEYDRFGWTASSAAKGVYGGTTFVWPIGG